MFALRGIAPSAGRLAALPRQASVLQQRRGMAGGGATGKLPSPPAPQRRVPRTHDLYSPPMSPQLMRTSPCTSTGGTTRTTPTSGTSTRCESALGVWGPPRRHPHGRRSPRRNFAEDAVLCSTAAVAACAAAPRGNSHPLPLACYAHYIPCPPASARSSHGGESLSGAWCSTPRSVARRRSPLRRPWRRTPSLLPHTERPSRAGAALQAQRNDAVDLRVCLRVTLS